MVRLVLILYPVYLELKWVCVWIMCRKRIWKCKEEYQANKKLSSDTKYGGNAKELILHTKGMRVKLRTNGIPGLSSTKPESKVRKGLKLNLKLGYRNATISSIRPLNYN